MNKAQNIMRQIYDTYAEYGVYVHTVDHWTAGTKTIDTYHDSMLYSYERAKSLYNNPDEYPMDEVLEALRSELKYIKHYKKIHILLATVPETLG